jgi:ribosomal protein S18 acetylase RimI-like enzyme
VDGKVAGVVGVVGVLGAEGVGSSVTVLDGSATPDNSADMAGCDGFIDVRRAREDDATGIAAVHVETWRSAYRDLMPAQFLADLRTERRAEFWRSEIHELPAERRPWVAEARDAHEIVGFEHSGPARDDDAPPNTGEIYLIYVVKECWSRGLGRQLMAHGERDLRQHGYATALLWVLESNDRARAFYERHGWESDGARKPHDFGGVQLVEVRYRKTLDT